MKKLFVLASILLLAGSGYAQSLETGIRLYQEGDFNRALQVFDDFEDDPLALLFIGKSHFSLGNFLVAKNHLARVDSSYMEVFTEAQYTSALADFQLKNFTPALEKLHYIKESRGSSSVRRDAITFYFQILNYLSIDQRFKVFNATKYDNIRLDLVKSAIGKVHYNTASTLLGKYLETAINPDLNQIRQVEMALSDSARYMASYNPDAYPEAPEGMTYNIGVALPAFDINSPSYEIAQNLYFGIQLAVEDFNSQNASKKVFLSFKNTEADAAYADPVFNELVWKHNVDAIIGPLFSEEAFIFSKFAEKYQIPLITPLANADSLNLDLSYTFQLNPVFSVHGKKMAQYAVNTLGYDTLTVIADRGSLGEASAIAFRNEAVRLGAEILKYYSVDLESQGYDISEFTTFLNPLTDTLTNYTIDAVYAPFTGQAAATLTNSLLTHLEAMRSEITVLGLEEWETAPATARQAIYFTKNFIPTADSAKIDIFESAYRLRFSTAPDFYSMIGYDTASVILEALKRVQNPQFLKDGLKKIRHYQGLIMEVDFNNTHINQAVKVQSLR